MDLTVIAPRRGYHTRNVRQGSCRAGPSNNDAAPNLERTGGRVITSCLTCYAALPRAAFQLWTMRTRVLAASRRYYQLRRAFSSSRHAIQTAIVGSDSWARSPGMFSSRLRSHTGQVMIGCNMTSLTLYLLQPLEDAQDYIVPLD